MACSSCASDCRCAVVAADTSVTVTGTGSADNPYQISTDVCAGVKLFTDNGREIDFPTDKVPVINGSNGCELVSITAGLDGPMGPQGPEGATGPTGWTGPTGPGYEAARTLVTYTDDLVYSVSDAGKFVLMDKGSAVSVTVNTGLGLALGDSTDFAQLGAGQVTFVASGVTILATPGLKISAQYGKASLIYIAADTYLLYGDLAA